MTSSFYHRFFETFDLVHYTISNLIYWSYSILIFSLTGTIAVGVFLSHYFRSCRFRTSAVFSDFLLRPMSIYSVVAALLPYSPLRIKRKDDSKHHSLLVECTCCFMNPATNRMNNEWSTIRFATEYINLSDCYHCSKHSNIASTALLRLNNVIIIVSRNRAENLLIPFESALLPGCSLSMRVSSSWTRTPAWAHFV